MNQTGPGLIDDICLAQIKTSEESILTDPDTATSLTVSTPTAAPTVDYASGDITPTTTDDVVSGLLFVLSVREIEASNGRYQTGDQALRVMVSDLSVVPTTSTTVLAGSTRYAVLEVQHSVITSHYRLILRRAE